MSRSNCKPDRIDASDQSAGMPPSGNRPGSLYPLEIYYDGGCRLCAGEMTHYRRVNSGQRLVFIDFAAPGFDPAEHDLEIEALRRALHVRDAGGRVFVGIDGFVRIWEAFPQGSRYQWLARFFRAPGLNRIARLGYGLFARYRHLLP